MLNLFNRRKEPDREEVCTYAFEKSVATFEWVGHFELIKLSCVHRFRITPSWAKPDNGYKLENRERNYKDFREALLLGRHAKPFERDWAIRLWAAMAHFQAPITHWVCFEYYSCVYQQQRLVFLLPICLSITGVDTQTVIRQIGRFMVSRFAAINELAHAQTIWYLLESRQAESFWIAQLFTEVEAQVRSLERQLQCPDILDLWRKF